MEKDRRYWILGFGAVAVALIFWLSPRPEEKKEEETASAPAEESLVEESPKPAEEPVRVTPTPEEFEEASRRERWEANFPYKPTYHPTLKFDPRIYDPANPATWNNPGGKRMHPVIDEHIFMRSFFENELRFTETFEQLYHLLEEYDRHDNPGVAAGIFNDIQDYHEALAYHPDEVIMKEVFAGVDPSTGEEITKMVPAFRRTEMTWGQKAHSHAESIVYKLHARKRWPAKEWMPEEEAMALRDRILAVIPPEDTTGYYPTRFVLIMKYGDDLEEGDSLLIPKEGWVEAYWKWQDWASPIIARRLEERRKAAGLPPPPPPIPNPNSFE